MARKGKSKVDWLNLFLEFVVVLIGILLAFQLNTCASNARQERIIDGHLEQLDQETEFNKYSVERAIQYTDISLLKLDTMFQLIAMEQDVSTINRLAIELLDLTGVYIRKNAYQGLVESGDIRFMKDIEAKRDVINLYEYYKWVDAFEEISSNLYTTDYYPFVRDNLDLIDGTPQADDIYFSKKFKNILGAYYQTSSNRVKKYKDCLEEIKKYLDELPVSTE